MTIATKLWEAIGYEPHEKQLEFHASDARFKVPVCGRRFGKSRMAAAEVLPQLLTPGTRGWIVGPEYKVGEKEFRYVWDDVIIKLQLHKMGLVKRKAYNVRTGEMYIEMASGSRLDVMSADHPESLVGEGLDYLIVSEAAKQNPKVWNKYLRPALADHHGTAIFPSTPEGFNWFYDIYRMGQADAAEHDPEWDSWRYPAWENPYVYPKGFEDSEVQAQMGTPQGTAEFWQEIGADFRSVVGLIYPEWDERIHVKRIEYVREYANYIAYDPGFTNPFAALDVMVDGMDNVYVWREWYEKGHSSSQAARALRARTKPPGYHIDCCFGDAAAPDVVEDMGMILAPTIANDDAKEVGRGIDAVKRLLYGVDGKPHLFVDPSCVNFIREINGYKMREGTKNADARDEPAKKADHAMDALRYLAMHLFVLGANSHWTEDLVRNDADVDALDDEWGIGRGIFTMDDDMRVTL